MINTNYTSQIIYKLEKLNEGLFSYLCLTMIAYFMQCGQSMVIINGILLQHFKFYHELFTFLDMMVTSTFE